MGRLNPVNLLLLLPEGTGVTPGAGRRPVPGSALAEAFGTREAFHVGKSERVCSLSGQAGLSLL